MRIGLIAPPWVPVPPPVYGGTELVVDHLARGLARRGHDVELFTTGDATCPVRRHWLFPEAVGTPPDPVTEARHVQTAYETLIDADVDVVHDHTIAGGRWHGTHHPGLPAVTTNHGPFTPWSIAHFQAAADHMAVVAVSEHQRSTALEVPVAAIIPHGIDIESLPFGTGRGGYVLFVGRMNAEKGVHRAIDVARAAGKRLVIAAKMWEPAEMRYFAEQVEPLLASDAVYVGEVGGARKHVLLAGAEALVNPIRWPEPFGLVMIEAMGCGTPVVTFREGAAPEVVEHGRTGFLCVDEADMARRLGEVCTLDRAACRTRAAVEFSTARLVDNHISLYERVVERAGDAVA